VRPDPILLPFDRESEAATPIIIDVLRSNKEAGPGVNDIDSGNAIDNVDRGHSVHHSLLFESEKREEAEQAQARGKPFGTLGIDGNGHGHDSKEDNARSLRTNTLHRRPSDATSHSVYPSTGKDSWAEWWTRLTGDPDVPVEPYQKAAVLVQFARDGENLTSHHMPSSQRELKLFKLRMVFQKVFMVCSFMLALSRFFERPTWTYFQSNWWDDALYPKSGED
jgi:hypothetical protein